MSDAAAGGSVRVADSSADVLSAGLRRQLDCLSLLSRRHLATRGQGDRRSPRRGQSLQLVDYRPYVAGDDPRQVDWNAYGRSGELFLRLYEDERTLTVHLLLDVSDSMDWGVPNKRAAALRLASALAYVALSSYDRLQIAYLGDRVVGQAGPYFGLPRRASALAALAKAPTARRTDLLASVGAYADRIREPAVLILITDLLSPTAEDGLRRLATGRHETVVLQLLAPQELDPEPAEDVQLVDRETGQSIDVNLDLATIARYRERLEQWLDRIAVLCRERNTRYARFSSADDLEREVIRALRRQGILQ